MRIMIVLLTNVFIGSGSVTAQTPNPYDGTWRGSFAGSERANAIELVISGTEGSVKMFGRASINPCLNRQLPVVVQQFSEEELLIRIEGSKVLQGCADRVSRLKRTGPRTVLSDLGATLVLQE